MNDNHDAAPSTGDEAAADTDPRFDPAAAGGSAAASDEAAPEIKSAQQQLDEMVAACNAWVRDKPLQALAVAAGLGFLLGRVGR